MRFTVEIECDNAAFENEPVAEVKRLLEVVLSKMSEGLCGGSLMDVNGNWVGAFGFVSTIGGDDNENLFCA